MTWCRQTILTTLTAAMLAAAVITGLGPAGCAKPIPRMPVTIDSYQSQLGQRGSYPETVVAQHNLQRVLDRDLDVGQRQESLQVVMYIQPTEPKTLETMAEVLADPTVPSELHQDLLRWLLERSDPSLTGFVVAALQQPDLDEALADRMLNWLASNAGGGAMEEIIKVWAHHRPEGPHESRFRQIVQRLDGRPWDEALLDAMNNPTFYARGSTMEILVQRVNVSSLKRRIMAEPTVTDTMAAIQTFIGGYDFIPLNRSALIQTAWAYKNHRDRLEAISHLASQWRMDPTRPYSFNIRDVPMLVHVLQDPQSAQMTRSHLLLRLSEERRGRQHAHFRAAGRLSSRTDTRLSTQADNLNMADLWNLWLLDELLRRGKIQQGITSMAEEDLADTSSANGGLILFIDGPDEADAFRYRPGKTGDDLLYVPSGRMLRDGRGAMCRFVTHFERIKNAERVGPTLAELAEAKRSNTYGLTLTSLDAETFSAHYYTPTGIVISIGTFRFIHPLSEPE